MAQSTQRILVADNHPLCRAGLATMLTRDLGITSVREAGDFPHALAAIAREPGIGLITVDPELPGMCGGKDLRRLRTDHPSTLLVVVASTRDRDLVLEALCAGVHGYIPKDLPADEMLNAFRSVLSGQIYVPAIVSDISAPRLLSTPAHASAHETCLTERQRDVLELLAAGRSNKEIARTLCIAEGTVKVHITAAFRALGVHNRVSAAAAMQSRPLLDPMPETFVPGLAHNENPGHANGPALGGSMPLAFAG